MLSESGRQHAKVIYVGDLYQQNETSAFTHIPSSACLIATAFRHSQPCYPSRSRDMRI
jgi:hypothetical protein